MRRTIALAALGLTALATSAFQSASDTQPLPRMVAAERAFAAATAELGVRDGFLTFLAGDAIRIDRGSTVTIAPARPALEAQPLPHLPLGTKLVWEPFTGNVSGDGTLGWLTGAYAITADAPPALVRAGAYFSVWKRQPDNTFRVWLDEGVQLPDVWQNASPFRAASAPDAGTAGAPNEAIEDAERAIANDAAAWRARLAASVRLHHDGAMPLAGRDAVVAWSATRSPRFTLIRTEVATSNDLAVTIGSFTDPSSTAPGSWVRVWSRDVTGRWRIVFETSARGIDDRSIGTSRGR